MEFFGVIFMIVWVVLAFLVIRMIIRQSAEKSCYRKMIANPCDATVLEYIEKFKATYGIISTIVNADRAVNHRNNLLRQSQGWDYIKNSDKVSTDVKEQLKKVFLVNGVPVK